MNLQGFTMNTLESEFRRVVRHETGHTLGFPHEHLRRQIVDNIDPDRAYAYFKQVQGPFLALLHCTLLHLFQQLQAA
jgi:hypothetical protein